MSIPEASVRSLWASLLGELLVVCPDAGHHLIIGDRQLHRVCCKASQSKHSALSTVFDARQQS